MALQGALEVEESLFSHKSFQTPHFSKRKWILGFFFKEDSLSPLSNFSPKHVQTPLNTLDSPFFSTIIKEVFLHPIFFSLVQYLGFDV